ncbi:MAG: tetratricopeptide repeat protein [Flavobacteriales bacterium]|nr:tetratricopeptide repeat protein [Flavobacteriales bacterium]
MRAPLLLCCLLPMLLSAQVDKDRARVEALYAKGKVHAGIKVCDKRVSAKAPDHAFQVLRAEGNNRIGEYGKALRDADAARPHVSGDTLYAAALQMGIALAALGFPDSAMYWYQQALGSSDDSDARLRIGSWLKVRDRCGEAITEFDRVLARHPDRTAAWRERGGCRAVLGDTAGARADLDRAIELGPRDPVNWNSRGYELHARAERWQEAVRDYDRAIKFDPNYSFAFNNRGWALHRLGETDKGIRNIELAGRKRRSNPYVYRNLGLIAIEQGDAEKGCAYLRTALEMKFTPLHGDEVETLYQRHCEGVRPTTTPGPVPQAPRGNAPVRSNAP